MTTAEEAYAKVCRENLERVARMYGLNLPAFIDDEQLSEEICRASGAGIRETFLDIHFGTSHQGTRRLPSVYHQIGRAIEALSALQCELLDWERHGYRVGDGDILNSLDALAREAESLSESAECYVSDDRQLC